MESVNPVEIGGNIRKFLISLRLEKLKKEFERNGGEWKEFKIGELFDIHPTKAYKLTNADLLNVNGKTPVVSNTGLNNGIIGFSVLPPTEQGNIITYSDTTTSDGIFYQPADFIGYPHIQGLYPHQENKWFEKSLLYFVSLFRKSAAGRFDYTNKFNRKTAAELIVILPATRDGMPNFSYMEQYISELEQARVSELAAYLRAAGLENYDLTAAEQTALDDFKNNRLNFKEFKIGNLFEISTPKKKFNANSVKFGGRFPYVVRTSLNNGIRDFLDEDERFLNSAGTISFGQDTATIFYQEKPYFTGDKIKILRFKIMNLNEKIANFMLTLMRKSFSHFQWGQSSFNENVLKNVAIKLPVTSDAPDFTFMESFITAQQKLAIRDIVLWKDKVISETRKIANV